MLREHFQLTENDLYEASDELDYTNLFEIAGLDVTSLKYKPWVPVTPPALLDGHKNKDTFEAMRSRDVLVHHPYESFDATVEHLIETAANDAQTIAIKMTVRSLPKKVSLETYYLGLDRKHATFQRGTAQELRHTLGARLSRPIAIERPGWDFDYEALYQFGTFGSANIRAWTVASETGYRVPTIALKPRFSAKADISSGDHPKSDPNTLGTFDPLFPKGNYFGVLATTGPGPINFIDFHPRVEGTFPHNITASFDWIFQWRESLQDGVYAVPGFLIRPADGSRARFVGHRPGAEVRWQVNPHLWFQADYGIFYAGRFIRETLPGRNLNYWALWAGYKF